MTDRLNPAPYPSKKDLEIAIQNGIKSGCFFSYILSSIDRRIDEKAEAVAYVSLRPQRAEWTLAVNPVLFAGILEAHPCVDRERALRAILIHEFLHIARDHFKRGFALQDKYSLEECNIAADLAVNSSLETADKNLLKEIGCLLPDQPPFNLPDGLSMEQYLTGIPRENLEGRVLDPKQADYEKTMKEMSDYFSDSPQRAGNYPATPKDLEVFATNKLKGRVRTLIKNLEEKPLPGLRLPGNGEGKLNWMIDWAFPEVKISWKRLLKNSLTQSGPDNERARSYRRSHPRAGEGILLKGKIPAIKKEQILILLDTSGSMRKEDFELFMGVIKSLLSETRRFSIMQWDCACQSEPVPVEKYMRMQNPRFRGGGGTDMRKGVLEASKRYPQYTKIVALTDGDTPYFTKKDPSPVPVIWALTSNARFADADGNVIRLRPR